MKNKKHLLKAANTALKENNYVNAIDGYITIIENTEKYGCLADQASFNLNLIPKVVKRQDVLEIDANKTPSSKSGSSLSLGCFDRTIVSAISIRNHALNNPAKKIRCRELSEPLVLFYLFHRALWNSQIIVINASNKKLHLYIKKIERTFLESCDNSSFLLWMKDSKKLTSEAQHVFQKITNTENSLFEVIVSGSKLLDNYSPLEKIDYKNIFNNEEYFFLKRINEIPRPPDTGKIFFIFRKESFSAGKYRAWISTQSAAELRGIRTYLIIDGKIVTSAEILANRPDVEKSVGKPAGEFILNVPNIYFDGKKHAVEIIISDGLRTQTIATEEFQEESIWHRYNKRSKQLGKSIILFSSHNLRVQGAQTSLYQMVVGLKKNSRIFPIIISPADGPLNEAYKKEGVEVVVQSYPTVHNTTEGAWLSELEHLTSCLKELSPKAVVANTLQSFHLAIAALHLEIPTILIPRESEDPLTYFSYLPVYIRHYANSIVSCSDRTVFVAKATQNLWRFADRGNQNVIHNGLETTEIEKKLTGLNKEIVRAIMGIAPEENVVLSVGTVCERKGQLDIIKSASILERKFKQTPKIFILGMNNNDYSEKIYDEVSRLPPEIRSKIFLLPHTENADDPLVQMLYLASDLFVMSSIHESYPRVVLEALYFSLPVIATRCFGVLEQIEDGDGGLFYESGDHHDLAFKISSILESSEKLRNYQKIAYERFCKLTSYKEMILQYKNIISDLIGI